jgi:hypothetical protein
MEKYAREDVKSVLFGHNVEDARRCIGVDSTEEVILLSPEDSKNVDVESLTLDLMAVLPHKKVWVVPDGPMWRSEPI